MALYRSNVPGASSTWEVVTAWVAKEQESVLAIVDIVECELRKGWWTPGADAFVT